MSIWRLQTLQEHTQLFLNAEHAFVGIDEEGIEGDYSGISPAQRQALFLDLQYSGGGGIQYGLVKRMFDDFCAGMQLGHLILLGFDSLAGFRLAAVLEIESEAYYFCEIPRQRRDARLLWKGEPILVPQWQSARRLEKLTEEGSKELILALLTALDHHSGTP